MDQPAEHTPREDPGRTLSRLDALISSLEGALLFEDETRRIVLVNQRFCELFSIPAPPDALVGVDCSRAAEQSMHLFEDPERFVRRIRELLAARRRVLEEPLALRDGRVLERDYVPVFEFGVYRGHLWHYRDVTPRVRAARRLSALHAVSLALGDHVPTEEAARRVLEVIGHGFSWPLGAFWQYDPESDGMRCELTWCAHGLQSTSLLAEYPSCSEGRTVPRGGGLAGQAWLEARPAWVEDLGTLPDFERPSLAERGLRSMMVAPVRDTRGVRGLLEWGSPEPRPRDEDLLRLLTGVGEQLGRMLEMREAQAERRASEARRSAIVESALDAVLTIDHAGRLTEFNPAAERLFGWRRADALGQPMAELLIPPELRAAHHAGLERLLRGGKSRLLGRRLEMQALRSDGSSFPVELSIERVGHELPYSFTAFVRDIGERLEVERLKKEFISTVSHELRTPLTSLRASLGLLTGGVMGELPPGALEVAEIAERSTVRLIGLINDILDLERLGTGRLRLSIEPTPLAEVLRSTLEAVSTHAAQAGVGLELPPTTARVMGDRDRLVQVLVNLVSNAVKFSQSGTQVEVAVVEQGPSTRVEVRDRGAGVPPDFRARVFEPFFQVDGSDSRRKGGSGLGLAICRALVEQQGGQIDVEPRPGGGSVFWFSLPAA